MDISQAKEQVRKTCIAYLTKDEFGDYVVPWLLAEGKGSWPAAYVCHPAIVELARHDEENGTDYLGTLKTYMACCYNASAAAKDLFIVRTTLLYRLERMAEIADVNFADLGERTYLALSLALWEQERPTA